MQSPLWRQFDDFFSILGLKRGLGRATGPTKTLFLNMGPSKRPQKNPQKVILFFTDRVRACASIEKQTGCELSRKPLNVVRSGKIARKLGFKVRKLLGKVAASREECFGLIYVAQPPVFLPENWGFKR